MRHLSIGAIKSHDGHASTKMHVLNMSIYYFGDNMDGGGNLLWSQEDNVIM